MHGLTIITGINYSGKGLFAEALQDIWTKRFSRDGSFITASAHMKQLERLSGYSDLASLPVPERNRLRLRSFEQIGRDARKKPVFLDAHFVFEDGEHVDFAPLAEVTQQIVAVRSDPEVILARALADEASDHPGRVTLRHAGIEFISQYQDLDTDAARQFSEYVRESQERHVGFFPIDNSGNEGSFRFSVEEMLPNFQYGFGDGSMSSEGGAFSFIEH